MVEVPVKLYMEKVLKASRQALRSMSQLSSEARNTVLKTVADRLAEQEASVLEANERDVKAVGKSLEGENKDRVKEAVDRVRLSTDEIKAMIDTLRRVADLPDPVGEVTSMEQRPNGMQVSRVRAPIGVIGVISEFGPLVMMESVALCMKAGNVCVYRGGPEWLQTTAMLASFWCEAAARRRCAGRRLDVHPAAREGSRRRNVPATEMDRCGHREGQSFLEKGRRRTKPHTHSLP